MTKWSVILGGLCAFLAANQLPGDEPAVARSADFKLVIESYALARQPVSTEDVVVRGLRTYVFPSNSTEVIVIDPPRKQLGLVDVARKVQTEVSFEALDEALVKVRIDLTEAAARREKEGGRANLLEARMTRDLFETPLAVAHDPQTGRVKLSNPAVEVEAVGVPDLDDERRTRVAGVMTTIARLGAFRTPNDLPPFAELRAIEALSVDRKLRPTELIYVYRLAGPPKKFRRVYRVVPTVTDRDLEAIARVDRLRESLPNLRYERYRLPR